MPKATNLTNQKFSRLTALGPTDKRQKGTGAIIWKCKCDCGRIKSVPAGALKYGNIKSCGCLHREAASKQGKLSRIHGQCIGGKLTKVYRMWQSILQRCYYEKHNHYKDYGGRGIQVYKPWHKFQTFLQYLKDNDLYKDAIKHNLSIDRFPNNNGNYEPGNIRITTAKEQIHNQRPRKKV